MLISDSRRAIFCHVPKCAGKTLKRQLLKQVDHDPFFATGGRVEPHPELGRIMPVHLPAAVLRDHFPETFRKLEDYRVFAMWRDPMERFVSALSQHAIEFREVDFYALDDRTAAKMVEEVMKGAVADHTRMLVELVHFIPQHAFVRCDSRMLVDEYYGIEDIDIAARRLSEAFGAPVDPEKKLNVKRGYRSDFLRKIMPKGARAAASILPSSSLAALRNRLGPLLRTGDKRLRAAPPVLKSQEVAAFVAEYYAEDRLIAPPRHPREEACDVA